MGARDFVRSLRPGKDRALATELRQREQAGQAKAVKQISDRDKQRTPQEVEESNARARRHKRGRFEPPAPGINP
ncbi:hypothetical protein ACFYOF_20475 [Streptomyces sp. NPDC007148]|uniref:hypothetical protein n=1 Tax=Streptomyces sp. NPDC007148 TaxID=3364775 RepID=UPI0036B26C93